MQAISVVERLALEYVRIKATPDMTPSDLLRLFNEAYEELYPQIMPHK